MNSRPLFITGASRSGTSMTAGLFAAHGLWFGPCVEASTINPKGFFESSFLKLDWHGASLLALQVGWRGWLEGHGAPSNWAVKAGPEWWPVFEIFNPVVVCCYRDMAAIRASRERAGFDLSDRHTERAWELMGKIPGAHSVRPDEFAQGNFSGLQPALDALGIEYSAEAALNWVDPTLWTK
ncbi:hypothetical protein ACMG4L_07725 [Alcanivorax sp. IL1]|uniref:hypothetical protein n=2 Tax=unclassified Alcanivorax TaxID=2638842 RepID=UPI0039C1B311